MPDIPVYKIETYYMHPNRKNKKVNSWKRSLVNNVSFCPQDDGFILWTASRRPVRETIIPDLPIGRQVWVARIQILPCIDPRLHGDKPGFPLPPYTAEPSGFRRE